MKSKKHLIVWLCVVAFSLIAQSCASSRLSRLELQQRDITIQSNAHGISDADAAVACYDMLTACERSLADSTIALQKQRLKLKKEKRKAWVKGGVVGVVLGGVLALFD